MCILQVDKRSRADAPGAYSLLPEPVIMGGPYDRKCHSPGPRAEY